MRAYYIDRRGRRLFAAFHPAERPPAAGVWPVLLCQPLGHEYVRAHRALRNLATQLARAGIATLRVDYSGTGDSAGDAADATLALWIEDVRIAVDELRQLTRSDRVSVAAVRFGAALAMRGLADRSDVERVVLWDPVLRGAPHLDALASLHEAWIRLGGRSEADPHREPRLLLGFPMSAALREEIRTLDLRAELERGASISPSFLWSSEHEAAVADLPANARRQSAVVPAATQWTQPETVHTALAAPQMLQAVARQLGAAAVREAMRPPAASPSFSMPPG